MAGPERDPDDLVAIAARISAAARGARFAPLVSLLERLLPSPARVGGAGPAIEETVRLRHDPSLAFSAGDVAAVKLKETPADAEDFRNGGRQYFEVTTSFLGLTGSVTPLPYYLAEEVAQEEVEQPHRREFLDLFHHRLLALLFRVLSKYDLASEHVVDGSDIWSKRILSLAGFDTFDTPATGDFPTWRLLRLSTLLSSRVRNAHSLEMALEDVLGEVLEGTRVHVREFVALWAPIAPVQRMRLGRENSTLGRSAVLGSRVLDRSGAFEIGLGPVTFDTYQRFLPGGDLPAQITSVVALFTREPLEHVLRVELKPETIPRLRLPASKGAGLGRDTWLGQRIGRPTVTTLRA
jgi:type VI secretion system protein ImpH